MEYIDLFVINYRYKSKKITLPTFSQLIVHKYPCENSASFSNWFIRYL